MLLVLSAAVVAGACADTPAATPRKKPKPKPLAIREPGPLTLAPDGAALIVGDRALRRVVRVNLATRARRVVASGFPEAIVGLGYDDTGHLYVSAGDRVYRLEGSRKVLVAGTGVRGHSGDGGPATSAQLAGAGGIDVDHNERIAIAEYDNWIRVVEPTGTIGTAAGNGGTGYTGDGGPAAAALLGHPHDVIWRRDDVLLVADSHNGVIRRVDAAGKISTFAAGFSAPVDLVGAPGDAVYVADAGRGLYRIGPEGGTPTLLAPLLVAVGVVVDYNGNAYVTQLEARRVVRVTPAGRVSVFVPRSR